MKLMLSTILLMLAVTAHAGDSVAQMTFRVSDDFGNVVTGAPVTISTVARWVPGEEFGHDEYDQETGVTDTNGLVVLKLPSKTGNVRYSVSGVFDGMTKMELGDAVYYMDKGGSVRFANQNAGQWHPWNPTVDIQLKKVVNPIPMLARSFVNSRPRLRVPEFGNAVGFDLIKGDWVTPMGKGEIADLHFKLVVVDLGQRKIDRGPLYDAAFSVTFTNDGDGLQGFFSHPREGSAFRSPRFAPEIGYSNALVKTCYEHETENRHEKREDQNYFIRLRTKKDESGAVIAALYGKIYGDITYSSKGVLRFVYYVNPTPNDRNMEFDPAQNLFTNLPSVEEVRYP